MYEGVKYMNNNFNNFGNEFSSMNDLFNQLMGNMGGYSTERRSYKINGREVTPEEFAFYRQTGRLPSNEEMQDAYTHFMELVKTISQSKQSYSEIFRMLSITRIELDFLGTSPLCELEKKIGSKKLISERRFYFLSLKLTY